MTDVLARSMKAWRLPVVPMRHGCTGSSRPSIPWTITPISDSELLPGRAWKNRELIRSITVSGGGERGGLGGGFGGGGGGGAGGGGGG